MSDLLKDPLEEPEQELLGIILYRFVVTILSVLLGFVLIPIGYFVISFLDVDVTEFETSDTIYFIVSTAIWMLIGLITPFRSIKRLFEDLKSILTEHVVIFIIAVVVFVFIYWFLITIIVSIITSILSIE
jgi:hypothetical protein